jgi:hypothetical protein
MPPNPKEKNRTVVGPLWDAVAFLIGATFDVLQTVLIILKTPMYVHSTAGS